MTTCQRMACTTEASYLLSLQCPSHGIYHRFACELHTARARGGSGVCRSCRRAGEVARVEVVSACTAVAA